MSRNLTILIIVIIAIAIALLIPIAVYTAYPSTNDPELIENIMLNVYGDMPKPLPRFIHGIMGYAFSYEGVSEHRDVLLQESFTPWVFKVGGARYRAVFMPRYICANNTIVEGSILATHLYREGRVYTAKLSIFRTPRGVFAVPLEIQINGTVCRYEG